MKNGNSALLCLIALFMCLSLCFLMLTVNASALPEGNEQTKFSQLSQAQKDEVWALIEKRTEAEKAVVEKLKEFKVLDEKQAEEWTAKLTKRLEEMKKEGKICFPKPPREKAKAQ